MTRKTPKAKDSTIVDLCYLCGEENGKDHKRCPMLDKVDQFEIELAWALHLAGQCDHSCCGLSPRVCRAKVVAHYLRGLGYDV
jgi:hypothetical protein